MALKGAKYSGKPSERFWQRVERLQPPPLTTDPYAQDEYREISALAARVMALEIQLLTALHTAETRQRRVKTYDE